MVNGVNIFEEISQAVQSYNVQNYNLAGENLGEVARKLYL